MVTTKDNQVSQVILLNLSQVVGVSIEESDLGV